jgi:hypothetical protein
VTVEAADGAALVLDEDWLRQKMRLALGIESRDGIDDLGDGVWRLGDARRSPVLLARDLTRVLHEPALLDRVRVAGGDIRVITPRPSTTRGSPFGAGVEWLALEERFTFYGGGITFIASAVTIHASSCRSGHAGERAVLGGLQVGDAAGWKGTPIQFTDGQAKVFAALWSFKGVEPRRRNGSCSARVWKRQAERPVQDQAKDKGKPEPAAQHAAYGALVVTQQRAGLYAMPCAAAMKGGFMT